MGLRVMLVSGPRKSGKGSVIRAMIDLLWQHKPHYVRLARCNGDKKPPAEKCSQSPEEHGLASARWVYYDDDRIFPLIQTTLETIHKQDRYGSVVIEADADPIVRCAYQYDDRVFVMPLPSDVFQLFRPAKDAASAMQAVLKDTTAFASEVFGLIDRGMFAGDGECVEREEFTPSQWRNFLYTPLGEEIITRILLQPPFHGLAESDVIIINTGVGKETSATGLCLKKLDCLLDRVSRLTERHVRRFACDLYSPPDDATRQLLEVLAPMCRGGR
ncbi:MAG: hypothetical protein IT449_11460 [Phycisphaerales bacterium]|nr:hypothetical protein [Phycisphaerales bacterium]